MRVISKIPVEKVIETAKKTLYTGHIGDGKIFVYDVCTGCQGSYRRGRGQNYGAGKMDRVHKGVRTCMGITAGATVLLSVILYNYASICYQLFTTDAQVVVIGEQILHFLVPTYFTYIAIEILSGTLRGIGDSWLPMIICCLGICALRVVWILTAVPLKNDILTIVFSYPLTWTVTSIAFIVYYLFFSRLKIVGRKR